MLSIFNEVAELGHTELPIPAILYGVIAMVAFLALGFVTWSYRDVANRHDHKSTSSREH